MPKLQRVQAFEVFGCSSPSPAIHWCTAPISKSYVCRYDRHLQSGWSTRPVWMSVCVGMQRTHLLGFVLWIFVTRSTANNHVSKLTIDVYCTVSTVSNLSALRSAARGDLVVPTTRLQLGNRAFCVVGPVAWNSLPLDISFGTYIINVRKHAQDTLPNCWHLRQAILHGHHWDHQTAATWSLGGLGER